MARNAQIRPFSQTALVACLALSMLVGVGGCQRANNTEEPAGATQTGALVPLDQLATLPDPKSYAGPSTAIVTEATVDPIATNVTPTLPVTVTDAQGTEVTVTDTSRILTLDIYGTLSQIVFNLGLGDRVVGRDTSSAFPEIKDLPRVTQNGHNLNGEAILELSPTVIITDTSLGPWDVLLQMRDADIPVVVVDSHRSVDSTGVLIAQVADALGVSEQGRQLIERTDQAITAKEAEIARIAPQTQQDKLRMAFLYVRGSAGVYYMFGSGSGADSLIEAIGGYDVSSETGWEGMRPLTDEGLVAAQPDLVLTMSGGLESTGGIEGLLDAVPALLNTPAGQNRRIVDMNDSAILGFGPRTANVLDALARAVYAPDSLAGIGTGS